jgi:hypothetical protein
MNIDDPATPEFACWQSYQNFARRVQRGFRYVWQKEVQAFLDTVLATLKERDITIPSGSLLYRARMGINYRIQEDEQGNELGEEPVGYGSEEMKPLREKAGEGRANPAGIPVLYLGTSEQTAISEVRPWIGSDVSVAQFKTTRALRAVDLSRGHGQSSLFHLTFGELFGEKTVEAAKKEKLVWINIDNAFSKPVTRSEHSVDYVPTQILTELFRSTGYDGIVYRSQFGNEGYNVALFDLAAAEAINCAPYRVSAVEVTAKEIGNRWFSRAHVEAAESGQAKNKN